MIFSCDTKMKNGFGIEGEKGVEAEELLTSKIWEVEQPATSWKLKTDHFPGDFAQVSTARMNLTPTYGSDLIDGPWKNNSWEKILRGKKWRCWSLFCKLIRGNFHLSQQLQVSTFLLISSAIPSHFPLIMSFAFFTVCIYFNNISNPNSPLSMNSLHILV